MECPRLDDALCDRLQGRHPPQIPRLPRRQGHGQGDRRAGQGSGSRQREEIGRMIDLTPLAALRANAKPQAVFPWPRLEEIPPTHARPTDPQIALRLPPESEYAFPRGIRARYQVG